MRKKTAIALSVPQPCQENWDTMTTNERGRHCSNCNKTVVDFSLYTDKELFNFFSNPNNNVCGRFNNYQLNRPILTYGQKRHSFFSKLFYGTALAGWLAVFFAPEAKGGNRAMVEQRAKNTKQHPSVSDSSKHYVYGTVVDSKSKMPIDYARLYIEPAENISVVCDSLGRFKLKIPDSLVGKNVTLSFHAYEYKTVEVTFVANQFPIHQVVTLANSPVDEHKTMGIPIRRNTHGQ